MLECKKDGKGIKVTHQLRRSGMVPSTSSTCGMQSCRSYACKGTLRHHSLYSISRGLGFFYPNSVATLKGFLRSGLRFDWAGSHKTMPPVEAYGISPVKLHTKWLLSKCPCASRLRRLAQNGRRGISVCHPVLNFHTRWLLWLVHVHFDCAGSHKTGVAALAFGISPSNFA